MKTKTLFILIAITMSLALKAQSFYVRGGLGAAVSIAPRIAYQYTTSNYSGQMFLVDSKRSAVGDGLPVIAAAGHFFNEHFGLELGIDYFQGFSHVNTISDYYNGIYSKHKEHETMLALVPAFIMKIDLKKLKPYARIGAMIGIVNSAVTIAINEKPSNIIPEYTSKDYGGISAGIQAALGAEFPLGKLISLFCEVNINGITWTPKKGKYIKYTVDGVDKLGTMTTIQKSWVYVKSIDYTMNQDKDEPDKNVRINYSFSNVGLIAGVKFNLGK